MFICYLMCGVVGVFCSILVFFELEWKEFVKVVVRGMCCEDFFDLFIF